MADGIAKDDGQRLSRRIVDDRGDVWQDEHKWHEENETAKHVHQNRVDLDHRAQGSAYGPNKVMKGLRFKAAVGPFWFLTIAIGTCAAGFWTSSHMLER